MYSNEHQYSCIVCRFDVATKTAPFFDISGSFPIHGLTLNGFERLEKSPLNHGRYLNDVCNLYSKSRHRNKAWCGGWMILQTRWSPKG